ncbi:DNA recombination protein RmuC [Mucilaginibacter arboris]|uniref:DNA recombination protein RmuC n=1 Tax=Mucilaginibacter arboris TaxID=2682090 RepID=A0A7K1SZN1_9SPHI|nr:DNA recombination protein RmuC [Mucilaginibacter arboris]MVN22771.1 DNA recombination protein RmuC [Mucilaginibacter arboris]
MNTILLVAVLVILLVTVFILLKTASPKMGFSAEDLKRLQEENIQLKISLGKAEERAANLHQEKENISILLREEQDRLIADLAEERDLHNETKQHLERSNAFFTAQKEQLEQQKIEVEQTRQHFQREFENVANKILEEKTQKFTESNRSNMDLLLHPLKENIKAFEEKVDKVYKEESNERFTLKGTIDELIKQTKIIQDDATNLTKALKGDTKMQGNWGEVILDRVLEASGLKQGESYTKQGKNMNLFDEAGNRFQPDVIVHLPENKHLIIDSKVSLIAYERLVNSITEEEKLRHLKSHVDSVKNHIAGLSSKSYQNLAGLTSPEFVLLFVPIESSFSIAIQHDLELFDFAWKKRVVLVTPSTLLATLKTIASVWKQEQQTKNAVDIATKAGALYDKFVGFTEDMKKIGQHIDRSKEVYNDAYSKLTSGSGNLASRAETLRKLGAKNSKQLDQKLLSDEE